jgi:hypothetical protein
VCTPDGSPQIAPCRLQVVLETVLDDPSFGPDTRSSRTCNSGFSFSVIDSLPRLRMKCYQDIDLWS